MLEQYDSIVGYSETLPRLVPVKVFGINYKDNRAFNEYVEQRVLYSEAIINNEELEEEIDTLLEKIGICAYQLKKASRKLLRDEKNSASQLYGRRHSLHFEPGTSFTLS